MVADLGVLFVPHRCLVPEIGLKMICKDLRIDNVPSRCFLVVTERGGACGKLVL